MRSVGALSRAIVTATAIVTTLAVLVAKQEPQPRFGGSYSSLDARRQHFVDDWVARFNEATGQTIGPAAFTTTSSGSRQRRPSRRSRMP